MTQLWNSGNKDTCPEVGLAHVGRIFIQHRARALGHCLLRELESVMGPPLTGEKETAGRDRLAVECHVIHDDVARNRRESHSQLSERSRDAEAFELSA